MRTTPAVARQRELELEDLVGLPAMEAIDRLRAAELRPAVEPCETADAGRHGTVIAHDPGCGRAVRRSQLIKLLVGQACPQDREVPATTQKTSVEPEVAVEHSLALPAVVSVDEPARPTQDDGRSLVTASTGSSPRAVESTAAAESVSASAITPAAGLGAAPDAERARSSLFGLRRLLLVAAALGLGALMVIPTPSGHAIARLRHRPPASPVTPRPRLPAPLTVTGTGWTRRAFHHRRAVRRVRRVRRYDRDPVRARPVIRTAAAPPASVTVHSFPPPPASVPARPPVLVARPTTTPARARPSSTTTAGEQTTPTVQTPPTPAGPLPGPYPNKP
jgi:hypothetical protein